MATTSNLSIGAVQQISPAAVGQSGLAIGAVQPAISAGSGTLPARALVVRQAVTRASTH